MQKPRSGFTIGLLLGLVIGFFITAGLTTSPQDRERVARARHEFEVQFLKSRISELEQQVGKLENDKNKKP